MGTVATLTGTNWTFEEMFARCSRSDMLELLRASEHGLERECLRVDKRGVLAQTPHPSTLGSALTHPFISTDFCEAQLELVTPPFRSEQETLDFLHEVHRFVYHHLGSDEIVWPSSAPCVLPDEAQIPLAYYGTSPLGEKKTIYRRGLGLRFGRRMQTLSGIHYNFSFAKPFWKKVLAGLGADVDERVFSSEAYLHIARNFFRVDWLNTYLFGATPAVDATYLPTLPDSLELLDDHTYCGEYATSIRMSDLGYYSKIQEQLAISYNSLESYIRDLTEAVTMPSPRFRKIGVYRDEQQQQLNDNMLQIEAEFYSLIRPKPRLQAGERPLTTLRKQGIAYLEVRAVDVTPFSPDGLDTDQLYFLHAMLLYCFCKESPTISPERFLVLGSNQNLTALRGRDPALQLQRGEEKVLLSEWADAVLAEMEPVAALLDKATETTRYTENLQKQRDKVHHPETTPSAQVVKALKEEGSSFRAFGMALAHKYCAEYEADPIDASLVERYAQLAKQSHGQQETYEAEQVDFPTLETK